MTSARGANSGSAEALAPAVAVIGGGGPINRVEVAEHAVAPAAGPTPWESRKRRPGEETPPMGAHVIGRPNDDLLDIILGPGVDPEQAFIGGREQGLEEGDGSEDHLMGEEPTVPEL